MSDTPTETDLARDVLQSEFNDLDVSGALVHAVEMFVEAKIKEAASMQWAKLAEIAFPPAKYTAASPTQLAPEPVPADVRAVAEAVAGEIDSNALWGGDDSWGMHYDKAAEIIARAILAEREAVTLRVRNCAAVYEGYAGERNAGAAAALRQFAADLLHSQQD